jgi:hypothetical protein
MMRGSQNFEFIEDLIAIHLEEQCEENYLAKTQILALAMLLSGKEIIYEEIRISLSSMLLKTSAYFRFWENL